MDGELYTLRFKSGVKGVQTGFLRATSLQRAVDVGRAYCNRNLGHVFISVESSIIADESLLDAPAPKEDDPDMIDHSELPVKAVEKNRPARVESPEPADTATIAQRQREEESEDEKADREAAEEEARQDELARGKRPDVNPNDPPAAAKALEPQKPKKLPKVKK